MPRVDVVLETPVADSFRVQQVAGLFDVELAEKSRLELAVQVPAAQGDAFGDWKIGAIVGPSGAGKSVVARQAFAAGSLVESFDWPKGKAVVDGFPDDLNMKEITGALSAVGFSSPPAWCLPYHVLSNGQRHRCDLARALLSPRKLNHQGTKDTKEGKEPGQLLPVVFDEFTSVVDRQVGKACATAVAKAVRKGHVRARQFVAVTCHYDVLEWLEPDWVLDMASCQLARGSLRRPEVRLTIHGGRGTSFRGLWPLFSRHHYLSSQLHRAARVYVAVWEGQPVGFCATLPNAGHTGYRIVHRLVVLPDYQGLGVGTRLLDAVAALDRAEPTCRRVSIRTSHPALIAALQKRDTWRLSNVTRGGINHAGFTKQEGRIVGSFGRTTASFVYRR